MQSNAALTTRISWTNTASDFVALTKPRITLLVLTTALGGLFMAPGRVGLPTLLGVTLGTCLIVAGANTLNMVLERDLDRHMTRTRYRPLPAGRMASWVAALFGIVLSLAAVPVLLLSARPITALLAVIAHVSYVFLYTPLKQHSCKAVIVGAVPGAIPPLLGWTAATGTLDMRGLTLFLILFCWQMPHFYAITLFRKKEYARAGFCVLPNVHGDRVTKISIVVWTTLLVASSLLPWALSMVRGGVYGTAALALGGIMGVWAFAGLRSKAKEGWAKSFFGLSMPYLVFLFVALLCSRVG